MSRALFAAVVLFVSCAAIVSGQDSDGRLPPDAIVPRVWPRSSSVFTTPDPFTVNGYDARHAMALVRRAGLLIRDSGAGPREIVAVRSVEAVRAGSLPEMPPGHRDRWDLLLNGEPLEWESMYIEYGGELLNLQLLFTYRNQMPVPDRPFRLE